MKIKDLKEAIKNLSDDMDVAAYKENTGDLYPAEVTTIIDECDGAEVFIFMLID